MSVCATCHHRHVALGDMSTFSQLLSAVFQVYIPKLVPFCQCQPLLLYLLVANIHSKSKYEQGLHNSKSCAGHASLIICADRACTLCFCKVLLSYYCTTLCNGCM